jgi:DNA-binding NtrC family response regulator
MALLSGSRPAGTINLGWRRTQQIASELFPHVRVFLPRAKMSVAFGGQFYVEFEEVDLVMAVILVVEDDFLICLSAQIFIEELGHSPLLAHDLASALCHLQTPAHIDALFVDIRLQKLVFGGYDVANQALELRPELRVLYTSGSPLSADMTGRFVFGGHFLPKPYTSTDLEDAFNALLAQNATQHRENLVRTPHV